MTTVQSFKIYEILGKHFGNNEEAKTVVTEIEEIIETKLIEKRDILATKEDLLKLQIATKEDIAKLQLATKEDLQKLQMSTKEDNLVLRVDLEKRFNQLTIWIVGVFIALASIIIAVAKIK